MLSIPAMSFRDTMPYVAIRTKIHQKDVQAELPGLVPDLYAWCREKALLPEGVPFFRYRTTDPDDQMVVDVGIPVWTSEKINGWIFSDSLPAGVYARIKYHGGHDEMYQAYLALKHWLDIRNMRESGLTAGYGTCWGGRAAFLAANSGKGVKRQPQHELITLIHQDDEGD